MTLDVRACSTQDEMCAAFAPIWHYFGRPPPNADALKHFVRVLEPQRTHAAYDGARVIGGAAAFAFDFTVPGGQVPAAGVTVIGVLPTDRRRGALRAMMRAQLDACRARGEPLAVLWASDDRIYRQFGYGLGSLAAEIDLPREHTAPYADVAASGEARIVPLDEAEPLVAPVHDQVARVTPGMFARSPAWWQSRTLVDQPWQRGSGGDLQCVSISLERRPAAYAFYRLNFALERGAPTGWVHVVEAMGATPQATHEIWRYLLDLEWTARVRAFFLPVDHPLLLSVAEPRRLRFNLRDGLWVRLVDVGAALSRRDYAADGEIVVDVTDPFCPWNTGRWRIAGGAAARTAQAADLRCDVSALGCVYLGGFTWKQLAGSLRVEQLRDGAVARADAMFATRGAPWCPEIF